MAREDFLISTLNRYLSNGFLMVPIHWPGASSGADDQAWIEPFINVTREASSTEYRRVTVEINVFQVDTASTYAVWQYAAELSEMLWSQQIDVYDWPDGGTNLVGCIRLFDPVLTYLGHVPLAGARAGLQQINLRVEGVFMGGN